MTTYQFANQDYSSVLPDEEFFQVHLLRTSLAKIQFHSAEVEDGRYIEELQPQDAIFVHVLEGEYAHGNSFELSVTDGQPVSIESFGNIFALLVTSFLHNNSTVLHHLDDVSLTLIHEQQ